jgi:hypothetical protein
MSSTAPHGPFGAQETPYSGTRVLTANHELAPSVGSLEPRRVIEYPEYAMQKGPSVHVTPLAGYPS